jgi:hypothetical protein
MVVSSWVVRMGSSRQLLDPRQELEIPREWQALVVSGQHGVATKAAILGLINVQEDLHRSIVRLQREARPREEP